MMGVSEGALSCGEHQSISRDVSRKVVTTETLSHVRDSCMDPVAEYLYQFQPS